MTLLTTSGREYWHFENQTNSGANLDHFDLEEGWFGAAAGAAAAGLHLEGSTPILDLAQIHSGLGVDFEEHLGGSKT